MAHPTDRVAEGVAHWARERPDLDTAGTEVVGRVLRLGAIAQEEIARALAPHRLGAGEYSVLAILRSRGAPAFELPPTALAQATYLTSGGIANLVKRLEARGLVARRPDPADGRGVLVGLTASGRARIDAAAPDVAAAERALVGHLPARERRALAGGLARLLAAVEGDAAPRSRDAG